jgi:PPM family protein phosphatase
MITVTVAAMTSRGLVRSANEDRIGVCGWMSPMEMTDPVLVACIAAAPLAVAVADGLGGHQAGEVASHRAIAALMGRQGTLVDEAAVARQFRCIHDDLLHHGCEQLELRGMATTLTAVVVAGERLLVGSVGDSRAYYVEPGLVEQLTADDTDPFAGGALIQVLGGTAGTPITPQVSALDVAGGMRLLLCSDGLHSYVPPARLRELAAVGDPVAAARKLHRAALAVGAPDNVSLCLVEVEKAQPEGECRG